MMDAERDSEVEKDLEQFHEAIERENQELYRLLVAMRDSDDESSDEDDKGPEKGARSESKVKLLLKLLGLGLIGGLLILSPILYFVSLPYMIGYLAKALCALGLPMDMAIVTATWTIVIILGFIVEKNFKEEK